MDHILEIKDLKTVFHTPAGKVCAVDGVSLQVGRGRILGIVGESGSGKSVMSLSIMQLLQGTTGAVEEGAVLFDGKDLLQCSAAEMEKLRGNRISMIFQEPMTSLNPVYNIRHQLGNVIRLHHPELSRAEITERCLALLTQVGIPNPGERLRAYPFELSGGMRQRVMIAMAVANHPDLIICDEPTTALDVTVQAAVLKLIRRMCAEEGSSAIFITHAMGVIAQIADDVAVMYCGRVMESAPVRLLFRNPAHPYTRGLLDSIPSIEHDTARLNSIEGTVPSPLDLPKGCVFAPRCKYCKARCLEEQPELTEAEPGHMVRCFYAKEVETNG